ncbi:MAG: hypothetical protein GWP08_06370 [Nitrospiraceae bacterium]|nr:hypothetical protein [Nitrospiraceae bacterium]
MMDSTKLLALFLVACGLGWPGLAEAQLRAGVATVSITPLEADIPTLLGGYGARKSEPAHGIHDRINAKVLLFEWEGALSALVTADVCSAPICVVDESLAKAGLEGLKADQVLMAASHSHAGLEGFVLDRRNTANNPFVGIFSEQMLDFVTTRIAQGIKEAHGALRPVTVAAGVANLAGMTSNRRGDAFVDDDLTLLRLDDEGGNPYAVVVNFTAHGTIMTEKEMLVSGGWAGNMQRTVEALMGDGVTCLYTNGAEGDIRPNGARGSSRWEMAEDYGRRVGIRAASLADALTPRPVTSFTVNQKTIDLPERCASPDFLRIAGEEYGITAETLDAYVLDMLAQKAPLYALKINDFEMVSIPGEALCQFGLRLKAAMRAQGVKYPCVAGLTSDYIGYVLSKDEYRESGYEATASFYGDGLGDLIIGEAEALAVATAK